MSGIIGNGPQGIYDFKWLARAALGAVPETKLIPGINLLPGTKIIRKFSRRDGLGLNEDADIWNFPDEPVYTYSKSADIDTISSGSASDVGNVIQIYGLNGDYEEVVQNATLDGQNKVVLTTPLLRIWRMVNRSSAALDGGVYVYPDTAITLGKPDDTKKVRCYINDGENQTLMCHYTLPDKTWAFPTVYNLSVSRKQSLL